MPRAHLAQRRLPRERLTPVPNVQLAQHRLFQRFQSFQPVRSFNALRQFNGQGSMFND